MRAFVTKNTEDDRSDYEAIKEELMGILDNDKLFDVQVRKKY